MIFGNWVTGTIPLGSAISAEIDLGRDWDYIQVQVPALDNGTLNVYAAEKTGGTFRALDPSVLIPETTGNYHDTWEIGGWQYIKIASSATQSAARSIRVRGCRE